MHTVFFLQLNFWKEPLQCGSVGFHFKTSFLKAGNERTSVRGARGGVICGMGLTVYPSISCMI